MTLCSKVDSSGPCQYKNSSNNELALGENNYCIFTDNKIYLSKSSSCNTIVEKAIYFKTDANSLYISEPLGKEEHSDNNYNGLIYTCDEVCKQEYNTFYLDENSKSLYECYDSGYCRKLQSVSTGFLLGNYNASDEISNYKIGSYSQLIKCPDGLPSNCMFVDISPGYYIDSHSSSNNIYLIHCYEDKCVSDDMTNYDFYYYYLDASNSSNIITCTPKSCSSAPGKDGYYFNSGADRYDGKSIIKCSDGTCTAITHGIGFYYSNGIYSIKTSNNALVYKCHNTDGCTNINYPSSENFYLNGDVSDPNKLIFNCNNKNCTYYEINEGYYVNADDGKNINTPSFSYPDYKPLIYCSGTECSLENINVGYIMNAGRYNTNRYIIDCTSSCESISLAAGYYLNVGKDKETYPVISCDNDTCKKIDNLNSSCSVVGSIIKSDEKLKFCVSNNDNEAVEVSPGYNNSYRYESFVTTSKDQIPGLEAGVVFVRIFSCGKILFVREDNLQICDNTSGTKCMNNSSSSCCIKDGIIYKPDNNLCKAITSKDLNNGNFYLSEGYTENYSGINDAYMVYSCNTNNDNSVYNCNKMVGFQINYSSVSYCNGWDNGCVNIRDNDMQGCQEGDEGSIGKEILNYNNYYRLCFGTKAIALPESDQSYYLAFISTKLNQYYGKGKGEVILLKVTPYQIYIISLEGNLIINK